MHVLAHHSSHAGGLVGHLPHLIHPLLDLAANHVLARLDRDRAVLLMYQIDWRLDPQIPHAVGLQQVGPVAVQDRVGVPRRLPFAARVAVPGEPRRLSYGTTADLSASTTSAPTVQISFESSPPEPAQVKQSLS